MVLRRAFSVKRESGGKFLTCLFRFYLFWSIRSPIYVKKAHDYFNSYELSRKYQNVRKKGLLYNTDLSSEFLMKSKSLLEGSQRVKKGHWRRKSIWRRLGSWHLTSVLFAQWVGRESAWSRTPATIDHLAETDHEHRVTEIHPTTSNLHLPFLIKAFWIRVSVEKL